MYLSSEGEIEVKLWLIVSYKKIINAVALWIRGVRPGRKNYLLLHVDDLNLYAIALQ